MSTGSEFSYNIEFAKKRYDDCQASIAEIKTSLAAIAESNAKYEAKLEAIAIEMKGSTAAIAIEIKESTAAIDAFEEPLKALERKQKRRKESFTQEDEDNLEDISGEKQKLAIKLSLLREDKAKRQSKPEGG